LHEAGDEKFPAFDNMFTNDIPEIDVQTLADKIRSDEDFILLDVREEWELTRARIADKRLLNLPLSRLSGMGTTILPQRAVGPERTVYVLCHHGVRSANVTRWMISQGWGKVFSVRGGVDEYARRIDPFVGFY